jgi:flap endonuclease GEN
MGAFLVFVVDGEPSALKSQAGAARSGMDPSAVPNAEAEADSSAAASPVKGRSVAFMRFVEECVVNPHSLAMIYLCAIMHGFGLESRSLCTIWFL